MGLSRILFCVVQTAATPVRSFDGYTVALRNVAFPPVNFYSSERRGEFPFGIHISIPAVTNMFGRCPRC